MPTLPLSRLPDYAAAPLAPTYEYPVDPTHEISAAPIARSCTSDRVPPNPVSWLSGADLLHYYPLLRVPTSVYLVPPPNPYLPRRQSGKSTSVSDRIPPTGLTHESPVDNNAFLNICSTSESRNPREFYSPQTSDYRATDATAAYPFSAALYSTPEQSVSLLSRPCHCSGIGRSGDFSSASSNSVLNSHPALHSPGSIARGPLHLLSLCPTPISTPISELGSCVYFPCSAANLYPVHGNTLAPTTYTHPSAATFQMDYMDSRKSEASDRALLQNDPSVLYPDPSGYTCLSPSQCPIPGEHQLGVENYPRDNRFGLSDRGQDQSPFQVSHSSTFLDASVSDIPLSNLEELLARTSIDDVYLGPVKGPDGKLLPLDPSVRTVNECLSIPYSASSLAFSPPGIIMVTEMWPMFVTDRLSHCNHRIHGMNLETLRNCLYDHNLNQLGSPAILRRRLQEFVRRVRDASTGSCLRSDGSRYQEDTSEDLDQHADTETGNSVTAAASASESVGRTMKLPKPVILTPDTFYSYLLIIDLEATCDSQERRQHTVEYPHEIIEFPVLLYNTRTRRCVGVFHSYCKPKLRPDLTSFCTNLTQISQVQVDNAYPFPQVLAQIEKWLFEQHGLSDVRCAIVCDCSADMSKFMRIQCRLDQIPLPSWATVWINLSKAFRIFYKLPVRHRVTLSTMLNDLNLSFVGQQHRGLDDAINILRVVRTLLADGCLLRVNERVDFGRPPNYVTSVPRLVAEATSGLMGSRLVLLTRKSKCNTTGYSSSSDKEDKHAILPSDLPEDHRQSLLWLASVQRTRVPRDQ